MDFKLVDTVRLQKFKDKLLNIINTKLDGIPTYTAGQGIKIENGVISVIERTKDGKPTCPGYTLYGDYFLSDTITPNKNFLIILKYSFLTNHNSNIITFLPYSSIKNISNHILNIK